MTGVFACKYADFLSQKKPLTFRQVHDQATVVMLTTLILKHFIILFISNSSLFLCSVTFHCSGT